MHIRKLPGEGSLERSLFTTTEPLLKFVLCRWQYDWVMYVPHKFQRNNNYTGNSPALEPAVPQFCFPPVFLQRDC